MSTNEPIQFSREFKLEVLRRMEAGENVSVLARKLGVSRKSIYQWRNRYRLGGGNPASRRDRSLEVVRTSPGGPRAGLRSSGTTLFSTRGLRYVKASESAWQLDFSHFCKTSFSSGLTFRES